MSVRLTDIRDCLQGLIPAVMSTCGRDGEPNVTYISQVHLIDDTHVGLSCQFFNKTRRNIAENPYATILLNDPLSLASYRLRLRFERAETAGPLFDTMAARIQVIASHTGMAGVFRLLSADVYTVLAAEELTGFLLPPDPVLDAAPSPPAAHGMLTELRGLQLLAERVARASDLAALLDDTLATLAEVFGFAHGMVLVPTGEGAGERLVTLASHGYGGGSAAAAGSRGPQPRVGGRGARPASGVAAPGVGAEVVIGEGLIGTAAARRRMIRVSGVAAELRYGRAVRGQIERVVDAPALSAEIPLPGLPDAQSQLALPLLVGERLVGVLAVESRDPLCFDEWDEAYLQIIATQIALGIDRLEAADDEADAGFAHLAPAAPAALARRRQFTYYRNDDCIFVDGEYLVRNVPAKILWRVLGQHQTLGQREFTNRELRLDPTLGLPAYRDNLESRLILLRRRLEEKCPDVRMVPVRRGRFALEVSGSVELVERESA